MPDVHIHIDTSGDPSLLAEMDRKLDAVLDALAYNIQQEEQTMLDLSALQDQVSYDTSVDESVKNLVSYLADQIANAPDQAAIDAIVDSMRNNNTEMAQFVTDNTPAAPTEGETETPGEPTPETPGGPITDTPTDVDPVTGEGLTGEGG